MRVGVSAYAAADAIPHLADVGLLSLESELVLLDEVLFINSVIDEIPRSFSSNSLGLWTKKSGLTSLCVKAFDQLSS
jgi:hypothetical protein